VECAHKETKLIIIIPGRYFLQQTERHLVSLAIRVNFPEFSLKFISKAYFFRSATSYFKRNKKYGRKFGKKKGSQKAELYEINLLLKS
jgi:hypothetical protein